MAADIDTTTDLARRLAAHPKWQWIDGMRAAPRPGLPLGCRYGDTRSIPGDFPDLADWATVGCLFGMLAAIDPDAHVRIARFPPATFVNGDCGAGYVEAEYYAPTIGEALAVALLDVWDLVPW